MTFGLRFGGIAAWCGNNNEEIMQVSFPGASFVDDEAQARQGQLGSTFLGCWFTIPGSGQTPTRYVWYSHSDGARQVGVNPGNSESLLTSLTGVQVQLASGYNSPTMVASATAVALSSTGLYSNVQNINENLFITGSIRVEDYQVGGSYDARGGGSILDQRPNLGGVLGWTYDTSVNSFALDTARGQQVKPEEMPTGSFRVIGYRVFWGTSHTGQIQVALYQGGPFSGNYSGSQLIADLGATSGSATSSWVSHLLAPNEHVMVNPANGNLWVMFMGDGATSPISSEGAVSTRAAASHYFHTSSNNAIWTFAGTPPSGANGIWPSIAPATGTPAAFKTAIQIIYQNPPYYGDFVWKSRLGMFQTSSFGGSSTMTGIFTSNAYTVPPVSGSEPDYIAVNYTAHSNTEQFKLEWWQGGSSNTNISSSIKVFSVQTSGTATGWNLIAITGSNPLTPDQRMWLSVKANTGGSSLGFGAGGVGYTNAYSPALYYRGGASESEYLSPDAAFSHDPTIDTPSPFFPSGTNINNGNATGMYGIVRIPGFNIQSV